MTDSITNKYGDKIRPGQLWMDNDPRSTGRRLRVVEVDDRYAYCESPAGLGSKSRKSRILIDRLHPTSTGYRLIEDPEGDPQ